MAPTVLITGASRGTGAQIARQMANLGYHVLLNFREKAKRANAVQQGIIDTQGTCDLCQADLCNAEQVVSMVEQVRATGSLDCLVLNASGGLEKEQAADYATQINTEAPLRLARSLLPYLTKGGRIVFVTSHQAHFYDPSAETTAYTAVAASKWAGEVALRELIPEMKHRQQQLLVVSGPMVEGTITPRLLDKLQPGVMEARKAAGETISLEDFAATIVSAILDPDLYCGATVLAGANDTPA